MEFRVPVGKICVFIYDGDEFRMKPVAVDAETVPGVTAFVCQSCGCREQVVRWGVAANGNTPGMYYYGSRCANPKCFSNQRQSGISHSYDPDTAD